LSAEEKRPLEAACDKHLRNVIEILEPQMAVGVGGFARKCLERLAIPHLKIGTLLHPSPASPIANRDWPERPRNQLADMGLLP
jgi:single-strand selective monofunctional uracil DNA glycosylase